MHVHSAQTTLAKVEEALDKLLPPQGTRSRLGRTETYDDDLIDLRVHYLGGRDVLAVAVHADHDADPPTVVSEGLIHVEHYGPDHRHFEIEGGPAMPPDSAGLVEDARRTWALWFGQDGRPTSLWLHRGADGEVIGDPIRLDAPVDGDLAVDLAVDPIEELLEAIRLTQEYAQLPAVDGWSWWDVYRKYRPADAERLRVEADRFAVRAGVPVSEDEFVNDPDPMVWAKAFASRFAVARSSEVDATVLDDVAGLMVGWFANFATAWERRVRERIAAETPTARLVIIRRQENGWDRFAFLDDDGHTVSEHTLDPRHVTLVHDRAVPPEWSGVWPQ